MSPQKTILITGGSGFIGTKLTERLLKEGYAVIVVDKFPPKSKHPDLSFLKLDLMKEILPSEYEGKLHGIVHLAGKNIFGRWTASFKKVVYDSRIESSRNLYNSFAAWQEKPKVLVSASAFGYYGNKGDEIVTEESSHGDDYGAGLCVDWEKEIQKAEEFGVRTVSLRSANVLGSGGFLTPLLLPFRFKLGFYLGKGEGWFPWIHIDDIVSLYLFALTNENVHGPVNAASPGLVTQKEFMMTLGKLFKTLVMVSVPIWALSLRYGELARTFNNSVKMTSKKVEALGFTFKYADLKEALASIVR